MAHGIPEARLVFDGDCGFCTRCVGWLRRLDPDGRVEVRPYQAPGVPASIGAGVQECHDSVQWLGPDGRRRSGADAVNAALSLLCGTRFFTALYGPTARLQEAAYQWVAAHRSRFPGTTPHCTALPGDCNR
jgi:predicted DCC family thiol-disulfide oxidoreductase YuxK